MTRRIFDTTNPDVNGYALMTALVVPRPIAWVSTVSAQGVANLAPHSFYSVSSARPPIVQFTSVGTKDTLRNVRATGEFVINVATEALQAQVNDSSAPWPHDTDEAEQVGITMEPSEVVGPLRVAASPASIECRLHGEVDLGQSVVVLGDVVAITVQESALEGDHPMMSALRPLSRLGRDEWGRPPEVVRLTRPTTVEDAGS